MIPGFTERSSQISAPAEKQHRYPWGIGGAVVVCFAVLAVIAVLVSNRIGHHGTASGRPAVTPSGAKSSSASASGSRSAATRQRGRAQASVIAGYLRRSGQARHRIGAAISAIGGCTHIASAVTTLRTAAHVRARIATSLASTEVSALRHGAAVVADLGRAMRTSASADRHYAAWGRAVTGCHGHAPHNAHFAAAQRSDIAATAAKQRFVDEWNPIAAMYGLAKQSANTF